MNQWNTPNSPLQTRALRASQIDTELIQKWQQLELSTGVANPFLSSGFVLPFLKGCSSDREPVFLLCENLLDHSLVGLGLFEVVSASKRLPLPHLVPFRSPLALRSGFLISQGQSLTFIDSLLSYLCHNQEYWFGIEFPELLIEQSWAVALRLRANDFGCSFRLQPRFECPSVELNQLSEKGLESNWSASRRKTMRRNLKRLNKHGEVDFQIVAHQNEIPAALERFLKIEHAGWKKEMGTSLLSEQADEQLIRNMVLDLAKTKSVLISELKVNDQVAATAINLISGSQLFAFKIGYNENFAEASPGSLHESFLVEALCKQYPHLTQIDGCARSDSYLNKLWPDRILVGEALLSIHTFARGTGKVMSKLRSIKHWASSLLS